MKAITRTKTVRRALAASVALAAFCGFAETPDYFVEWVKPSGNLYVDTGIRGKSGTKISVRFYHADADNYANIIGASASGGTQRVGIGFWGESNRYNYGDQDKDAGGAYVPNTYDYIIEQEFSATGVITSRTTYPGGRKAQDVKVDVNTTDYSATQGAVDSGVSLYLFARNNGGAAADFHRGRLYECKVWQLDGNDAWQLAGNFMPCVKDGVAGVYDAVRETILYPVGNTLTAGPAKNLPSWPAAAKVGSVEHPATLWGRISYGASRSGMGNGEWKNIGLNDYVFRGAGDIANLNANSGTWMSGNLAWSQLRFDGWFYVSDDKAGSWTFQQGFDDYFSLTIDGVNVICNPTYNLTANTAAHAIAAGWHRFTIVCGDTYGGYGSGRITLGGVKVPFTVSINGGTALAFNATNFPQGSGRNRVTLDADADWSDRGDVILASGAVLDLNGHSLTVKDIVCDDYVGAVVTNSAAKKSVIYLLGEPTSSKGLADGLIKEVDVKIIIARNGDQVATWTGAANDGSPANAGNWEDLAGEPVVPTAAYTVKITGSNVNMQCPAGTDIACKSFEIGNCTFTANCDWRGLSHTPAIIGAANLNGHVLTLNRLSAIAGSSFSGGAGSAIEFVVDESATVATLSETALIDNAASLSLSGDAKILLRKKDGGGTLTATQMLLGSALYTELVQTNGAVNLGNKVNKMGDVSGRMGTYTMKDGTLTTGGSSEFVIGADGIGTFNMTGGSATIGNWISVGRYSGGNGTFNMTGGSLTVSRTNRPMWVGGDNGTGTFNFGGTATANFKGIDIGKQNTAKGYLNMDGGTLTVSNGDGFNVGRDAAGTVVQNDGTLNVNNTFRLAWGNKNDTITGSYTLNGGVVNVNADCYFGDGRIATYVQNGGTMNANNGVTLANQASSKTTVTLAGGVFKTKFLKKGSGTAAVTLAGGTLKAAADGNILEGIDNLVFGNGTTIDTDGHNTSITGCGYDTVPGSSFVKAGAGTLTAAMPPVETLVVSNGVLALSAAADNRAPLTALAHRWSFTDGSLADSVGGAPDATTVGTALAFADGKVTMSGDGGGTGSLVLGSSLIPGANVTIEIWAQKGAVKSWSRIFEYGYDTSNVLFVPWTYGTTASRSETTLYRDGSTTGSSVRCDNYYNQEGMLHIVVRIAATGDGKAVITTICRNSDPTATPKTATFTTPTWALAKIAGGEFYLGRSHWNDADANATYDEVRIWNGALSDEAIALSYAKGANATTADIAEIVAVDAANVSRTLDLSGGTLDLGGNTLTQPNLTCNGGTVRNGTLTVTDTILLNVGDSITASGTIDLTDAKVQLVDPENLTDGFYFIKPAAYAPLSFVGKPTAENLPTGWQLSVTSNGAKVQKVGFSIYLR